MMKDALRERGDTVSRYLASVAEYGVITGNTEQLYRVSDSILQGDIVALTVYDFESRVLLSRGEAIAGLERVGLPSVSGHCGSRGEYLVFCAPIQLVAIAVSDYEQGDMNPQGTMIGHVKLVVTTRLLDAKREVMLRWTMTLLLLIVVGALWLSRRIERQLVVPLGRLSRGVERVRAGDLTVQVDEDSSGELLVLQRGVNAMVAALASARQVMEQEIENATHSLRDAMTKLEQSNEQLRKERQRAESASLAKSQFLATMSHEIRTPLSGMIGMLQLLRDGNPSRQQNDCIDGLELSAQSLRQLIDDILDFSRLEAGKLAVQSKRFSPLAIVEEVMAMLTPSAYYKGLEFVLDIQDRMPGMVLGDPLRFRQVLINLTANAIKFTDKGEVVVAIRDSGGSQAGRCRFRVEVRDSGIGIAADKQELVFESFTQLDEGDSRSYGGSGLGTAVSRELVQLMGGEIGLRSELGKGSCFWFELPWQVVEMADEEEGLPGGEVWLLEQHEATVTALRGMLQGMGCTVRLFGSVEELRSALGAGQDVWIMVGEDSREVTYHGLIEELVAESVPGVRLCQLSYANGLLVEGDALCLLHKPVVPSALFRLLGGGDESVAAGISAVSKGGRVLSVLLAEDDDINAKVISHFLTQGGHQVTRVADGAQALEQLRQNRFDCVLMDMRMPGLDGLEATRRWRREEHSQWHLPIIALTANASEEDRRRCSEAGMDGFLTKPVSRIELLDTLVQCSQSAVLPHEA